MKINLDNYSKNLLTKYNLIESKNNNRIIKKFTLYINILIYNITTLVSIIAILLFNTNHITKKIIKIGKIYIIKKMCIKNVKKIQSGGTNLPPIYYGNTEDNASYNAALGSDVQNIEWNKGLVREALIPNLIQNGGCNDCDLNKTLLLLIGKIIKEHKMKINKNDKQNLANIIKLNITEIINLLKLKSKNKKLTIKSLNNILLKSKMKYIIF